MYNVRVEQCETTQLSAHDFKGLICATRLKGAGVSDVFYLHALPNRRKATKRASEEYTLCNQITYCGYRRASKSLQRLIHTINKHHAGNQSDSTQYSSR